MKTRIARVFVASVVCSWLSGDAHASVAFLWLSMALGVAWMLMDLAETWRGVLR